MRASIESRFSSFEEKMLGLMADFQKQQRPVNTCLTNSTVTNNVCVAQRSTSGACQPTGTKIHALGSVSHSLKKGQGAGQKKGTFDA